MNITMSERTKHRILGIIVLLSVAIIFLPVALKKSNRNFEQNIKMALKFPSKPVLPKVDLPTNKEMFSQAKVVDEPKVDIIKIRKSSLIAKAEPLEIKHMPVKHSEIASISDKNFTPNASHAVAVVEAKPIELPKAKVKNDVFSIQVATFVQKNNADALVKKLEKNGFNASYNMLAGKKGVVYQVVVGRLPEREQAIILQKKLANNMQLNGLIIKPKLDS